jgi:hypothetical protein
VQLELLFFWCWVLASRQQLLKSATLVMEAAPQPDQPDCRPVQAISAGFME